MDALYFADPPPFLNVSVSTFCHEASSKSDFSITIGALLTVGACISYLPQHVRTENVGQTSVLIPNKEKEEKKRKKKKKELCTFVYFVYKVAIIRSKRVDGLSWPWLFMSCVASYCLLVNVVCLRWEDIRCCEVLPAARCQLMFLPLYQVSKGNKTNKQNFKASNCFLLFRSELAF
jgi:hypothetical protein